MVKILICSILFVVLLLGLLGCSNQLEFQNNGGSFVFNNVSFSIGSVQSNEWELGLKKKAEVTKDLLVKVYYPPVSSDIVEEIRTKYVIDSWIIRVRKKVKNYSEFKLGYAIIPFNKGDVDKLSFLNFKNKVSLRLAYEGSYPTYQNGRYPCARNGHNLVVTDYGIHENTNKKSKKLVIYASYGTMIAENEIAKTQSLIVPEFNGGESLIGEYFIDFALYSMKEKLLYSDFLESDQTVFVSGEEQVSYTGCDNYTYPALDDKRNIYRIFKIY